MEKKTKLLNYSDECMHSQIHAMLSPQSFSEIKGKPTIQHIDKNYDQTFIGSIWQ